MLRDGRKTGSVLTREAKQDVLIKWMVGREVSNLFPKSEVKIGEIVLEVKNLTSLANGFKDVSFFLKKGEILGLFGLIGAKRTELVRALFGADRTDSGEIYLDGKLIKNSNTESMSNKGMGMVPEDRKYSGIFPILSVGQNISIASLNQFSKLSFINRLKERKSIRYIIDKLNIKTPSIERQILYLSGGNQQKVIISRWLIKDDIKVLIMDEPTRGIDVGAKSEVHKIISDLAGKGIGIIMVSSELPEILGMSDRIAVMRDGRIAGIFTRQGATQEDLLKAAILI
ncbi:MAG: ATP-binding cassette domain-containing protein [Actinobacteria bacterium]|nr:ATP-binding cassette domain-containing protein [Actinomycetota bacterium]